MTDPPACRRPRPVLPASASRVDGNGQPDVFGPFTIPDSTADGEGLPPRFTWVQHAEAAAAAAGVDFSRYQHRVFVFPRAGR